MEQKRTFKFLLGLNKELDEVRGREIGTKPLPGVREVKKIEVVKDSAPVDRGRYRRLIGRLIYISYTRPDIGFFVSVVSQFMNNPIEEHMEAVN